MGQIISRLNRLEYNLADTARQFEEARTSDEERSEFEIDRARIIHSAAFRRLQGKTQVFVSGSGDFFRTRLTHSLETSQIGKGLALRLGAHPDLVETCCLAHDLGHPPFGHTGEAMLAECMLPYGGFEGNAQNIRLIARLSTKFLEYDGLNLTRATLDGILKYKVPFAEGGKKFYYDEDGPLVAWAGEGGRPQSQSFECQLMDWADEIAYSVHDLEDGMKAGMISSHRLGRIGVHLEPELLVWVLEQVQFVENQPSERSRKAARKVLTSRLIHEFVTATERQIVPPDPTQPTDTDRYRYRLEIDPLQKARCSVLKEVMFRLIVEDARIATLENKAERIIRGLFEVFSDLRPATGFLFPEDFRDMWEAAETGPAKIRIACDYIAGMTDTYAEQVYARLYLPQSGTIYQL